MNNGMKLWIIDKEDWEWLQEEAKKRLDEYALKGTSGGIEGAVHPDVKAHLESIVAGNIPFGYTLEKDGR